MDDAEKKEAFLGWKCLKRSKKFEMLEATKLYVAFDPGTSLTKIVYELDGPKVMLMGPESIKIPEIAIEGRTQAGIITPENDAWLKIKKRSEQCYAVGYLAQQLNIGVNHDELKYEQSIIKVLAAVGAIFEKENLLDQDAPVQLYLIALLPYGEFSDRKVFKSSLKSLLMRFYFRGHKIRVEPVLIEVKPEGGGYAEELIRRKGANWFVSQNAVCALMVGHRNASLLTFTEGKLDTGSSSTSRFGFHQFINSFLARGSDYSPRILSRNLYEAGDEISSNNPYIRNIAKSKEPENFEAEVERIVDGLKAARQEYWVSFENWLRSILPGRIDFIFIGGGGGHYFRKEIEEYLDWTQLDWGQPSSFIENVSSELEDNSLNHRLVDVWLAYSGMMSSVREEEKEVIGNR